MPSEGQAPNTPDFSGDHTRRITAFLRGIGLEVRSATLPDDTFLPGIWIESGALVVDENRLSYPGDLLHEAGHLAVLSPDERAAATGEAPADMGAEIAAQAWSYAAALASDTPLEVLFHDHGYKGASEWFHGLYAGGATPGVPLLAWYGMTVMPTLDGANAGQPEVFPRMTEWLRTTPNPPYPDT
ncbi:hypothetical protein [Kordiimonas marina]|uniref:hypothetical protein n=1 Tax=Kordiimonas marina TaxID=2872312 RepID=UPI001FF6544D|nr:hypothetical protein [Kordiimonas marina]MCJ9427884.1 hypothetical protein [Kordiimonas marina]